MIGGLWYVSLLVALPRATPLFVLKRGLVVIRDGVVVQKVKFCLKRGNCSVQGDGVLMIYCVETEQFFAYFG